MDFTPVKELLDSFLEQGLPGFDFVLYHKGRCVLRHMNGVSDLEKQTPVCGKELYNIYSCTKPITVAAALLLWEQGKLRLEDRLSDYISEFSQIYIKETVASGGSSDGIALSHEERVLSEVLRPAENTITIENLFTMRAGMNYNTHSPGLEKARKATDGRCPTLETIRYFAADPLRCEPGTQYRYSLAHDVLAAVIEVVSGMRYGEFVAEHIFKPLGMENSTYLLPEERLDEVCGQYEYDKEKGVFKNAGKHILHYKLGSEYESGGAGLVCTVEDYIRFLEGLRTGKILKQETIDMMTTPRVPQEQYTNPNYAYGLGVRCPKPNSEHTDFGWGGHAGSYLAVDRKHEFSFFYAQHAVGAPGVKAAELTPLIRKIVENS